MSLIKNQNKLIEKGKTPLLQKARGLALKSLENALKAVDPKKLIYAKLRLNGSTLTVDNYSFDLSQFENVYVVGGGKAGGAMAQSVEEILSTHITAGFVNVPYGNKYETKIIKVSQANHPVPDEAGVEGTCRIIALAEQATKKDFVICLISGGGSSLMPLPRGGITLEAKITLTNALLKSGATINEVNTVRKHISAFKGGWLAKKAYPATLLNLILSDVIGDSVDAIASGPAVPDSTTFADAQKILEKYCLWENTPASIREVLSDGIKGLIAETPKASDPVFEKVYNVIIGNNKVASLAALEYLKTEGLNTLLLSTTIEGEAKQAGTYLASIALQDASSGKPLSKPAGIVAGGETTVTVTGKGAGGRNQELALSAALKLQGTETCVMASFSTDGVDGPTDAAGAIVDGYTISQADQQNVNAGKFLANNDSYRFFAKLGDLIVTGATGTNVNDISVIIVL